MKIPGMVNAVAAYIALGSNLGDRLRSMQEAVRHLSAAEGIRISGMASLYETDPLATPTWQPPFLNSVARAETALSPEVLMAELLQIETRMGRTRESHLAPRVIDLDLLFYGDFVVDTAALTIPHPRLHERRFVLEPLAEVNPGLVHPVLGRTMTELNAQLKSESSQGVRMAMGPNWADNV